jgi:hypothetical protein
MGGSPVCPTLHGDDEDGQHCDGEVVAGRAQVRRHGARMLDSVMMHCLLFNVVDYFDIG